LFLPGTPTVPVGTTVTGKFDDSMQHTVTADDNSFGTAGTVAYLCSSHPFMTGTIVVR
jgi:plastocyanin